LGEEEKKQECLQNSCSAFKSDSVPLANCLIDQCSAGKDPACLDDAGYGACRFAASPLTGNTLANCLAGTRTCGDADYPVQKDQWACFQESCASVTDEKRKSICLIHLCEGKSECLSEVCASVSGSESTNCALGKADCSVYGVGEASEKYKCDQANCAQHEKDSAEVVNCLIEQCADHTADANCLTNVCGDTDLLSNPGDAYTACTNGERACEAAIFSKPADQYACIVADCASEEDVLDKSNCLVGQCAVLAADAAHCRNEVCQHADASKRAECEVGSIDCSQMDVNDANAQAVSKRHSCRLSSCALIKDSKKRINCMVTQCEAEKDAAARAACRTAICPIGPNELKGADKTACEHANMDVASITDPADQYAALAIKCSRPSIKASGTADKDANNCVVEFCSPLAQPARDACSTTVCGDAKLASAGLQAGTKTSHCEKGLKK